MNWKIIMSTIAAILLTGTIVILTFFIGDSATARVLNLAVVVFGYSTGWVVGVVISPYSKSESDRFTVLTKAIGAFASGYLVGKLDKLVEQLFRPDFLLESVNGFRMIAFMSTCLVSMIVTFIYRTYARINA
jgi:hypothetical protein